MKILVIDNFDSFTFNLVHYLEGLDCDVDVFRNDQILEINTSQYQKVIISPGPGLPQDSSNLMKFIELNFDKIPILGVCLGMQALAVFFNETLYNLNKVKHGISEEIEIIDKNSLFKEVPNRIAVGLYHSWAVELKSKINFKPLAFSKSQVLMAFQHKELPLYGVQFHPESILTQFGKEILMNFLAQKKPLF